MNVASVGNLGASVGIGKTKGDVVGLHWAVEQGQVIGDENVAARVPHHVSIELRGVGPVSVLVTEANSHALELLGLDFGLSGSKKFPKQPSGTPNQKQKDGAEKTKQQVYRE